MRYHLQANGSSAEVSLTPLSGGEGPTSVERVLARVQGEDQSTERHFVLGHDLVQELQPDGSLRRLSYTAGRPGPKSCTFFYKGRLREVHSVGGVGGSVEGSQSEGSVSAPMNGQVVKVQKNPGDAVKSGEIVLILEAMKMENEVTAPIDGVLGTLQVEPGQAVSPGQHLFTIETAD